MFYVLVMVNCVVKANVKSQHQQTFQLTARNSFRRSSMLPLWIVKRAAAIWFIALARQWMLLQWPTEIYRVSKRTIMSHALKRAAHRTRFRRSKSTDKISFHSRRFSAGPKCEIGTFYCGTVLRHHVAGQGRHGNGHEHHQQAGDLVLLLWADILCYKQGEMSSRISRWVMQLWKGHQNSAHRISGQRPKKSQEKLCVCPKMTSCLCY